MTGSDGLDPETACLVRVSAALATGDQDRIRESFERALEDAGPVAVEEVLLQSHLFLGFPAALQALALWREVYGRPAPDLVADDDAGLRRVRGERLCRIVYGEQYDALRRNIRGLHPAMERWMLEEGYGKVLARPGLELKRRELSVAALLAVLGTQVQLRSHLRGALRAGADPDGLEDVLRVAAEYQDEEGRRAARDTWTRVRERWNEAEPQGS